MYKFHIIAIVFVICYVAACTARPTTDEGGRKISSHARTSTRKRDADFRITHRYSKNLQELKRMMLLNNLVGNLEGNAYSVENVKKLSNHARFVERNSEGIRVVGVLGPQVLPKTDTIPNRKAISEDLISQLNGEKVDGRFKVHVVNGPPVTMPRHLQQFVSYADDLRQKAAATKTCKELQKTLLQIPNVRIKVSCRSTTRKRDLQGHDYVRPPAYLNHYNRRRHGIRRYHQHHYRLPNVRSKIARSRS